VHEKGLKSSKDTWEAYSGLCVTTGYHSNLLWTIKLDLACVQLPAGLLGSSDNVSFCGFLWGAQLGKKLPPYPLPTHEALVKKGTKWMTRVRISRKWNGLDFMGTNEVISLGG
ncbi:hypothetical protein MKW92_022927, partial [Papaver armeniacum]